jgi:sulfatase maturation enzyme AslB (radical SAM superfamily)
MKGVHVDPITCEVDPSNYCQNDCEWCIYRKYIKSNRQHLDFDLFRELVRNLERIKVRSITFTGGGEPLMHPQFEKMVRFASKKGLKLGLVTNGIFLDRYEHLADRFQFIRISLDEISRVLYKKRKGTDSFNHILINITRLVARQSKQKKCQVGISKLLTGPNPTGIKMFRDLGKELKVDYVQIKPAWRLKNIEEVLSKKGPQSYKQGLFITPRFSVDRESKVACKISGLIGQVGADAKVYYCCVHRGKKEFEIGDLEVDLFSEIIRRHKKFVPDMSICGSCRYMNYAKIYQECGLPLRHRDFL